MRDEIDIRAWADHGQVFSADLERFLATAGTTIGTALRRLNELEFDAPWKRNLRGPGQA